MTKRTLKIKKGMYQGIDSISVEGHFDLMDKQIDTLVEEIIGEGKKDIVFDFNETIYISSSCLAVLIKALKKVQSVRGTLYIANITQDMHGLLSGSSLNTFVKYI